MQIKVFVCVAEFNQLFFDYLHKEPVLRMSCQYTQLLAGRGVLNGLRFMTQTGSTVFYAFNYAFSSQFAQNSIEGDGTGIEHCAKFRQWRQIISELPENFRQNGFG